MKNKKLNNIKKSGFKTPDDYFVNFDERLLNQVDLSEKLDNSGFKVPDSYFKEFDERMFKRLNENKDTPKVISLIKWKKAVYAAAAAACLLLLFNLFYPKQANLAFDDLETASIVNYVEFFDFTNDELADLLPEESLIKKNFIDQKIDEEQLENYLLYTDLEELILN